MIINSKGYELKFIQTDFCRDKSDHLFTNIYTFFSSKTKLKYVIRAEYHSEDVFVVKFYCKAHRKSNHKYSKITNRGDVLNILVTNAKVIPDLLKKYPEASFGFTGSRSIDFRSNTIEGYQKNQRYRVYCNIVQTLIGSVTFTHFAYENISGYMLINNKHDIAAKKKYLEKMFIENYSEIHNIL